MPRASRRNPLLHLVLCLAPAVAAAAAGNGLVGVEIDVQRATVITTGSGTGPADAGCAGGFPEVGLSEPLRRAAELVGRATLATGLNPPPAALVAAALLHTGNPDPNAQTLTVDTSEDGCTDLEAALGELLAHRSQPATHLGIASVPLDAGSRFRRRWVALVVDRRFELAEPLPTVVRPGQRLDLRFTIDDELSRPQLVYLAADGDLVKVPLDHDRGLWSARWTAPSAPSPVHLQLLARDPDTGPTVLGSFAIAVDDRPAADSRVFRWRGYADTRDDLVADPTALAAYLVDLANWERGGRGLGALTPDPELAAVALAHTRDMAAHGFIGHRSPTTGEIGDRLEAAGYLYARVRENVAAAGSADEAHEALMASPAHRSSILADDVSRIGVGVVVDTEGGVRRVLVTEIFAEPLRVAGADDLRRAVMAEIDRLRAAASVAAVREDPELDRAAQLLADDPATLDSDSRALFRTVRDAMDDPAAWPRVHIALRTATTVDDVAVSDAVAAPGIEAVGVGIARLPAGDGPPMHVIAVVFAGG